MGFSRPAPWRPTLVMLLYLVLGWGMSGCSGARNNTVDREVVSAADQQTSEQRPLVLTTFTILADMARQVAGPHLQVESLLKPGAEVHGYEPTPLDLRRSAGADLILTNGLNLELWSDRFFSGLPHIPRVVLSDGIAPLPIADDGATHLHNPHAWMSPRLARVYLRNLRDAFIRLDPAHAANYRQNAATYEQQLLALDGELRQALALIPPEQRMLVTCEGAFSYLAQDYGLEEAYLWPVNGEREVTPRRLAQLIDLVRRRAVPAVFCETTVNATTQREVAAATGARFGGLFYVDSLSLPDGPAPTLLELQRHNTRLIMDGLGAR